jgi:ABC-type phosphate/phosphonate transport system substrate-binding protein
MKRLLTTPLLLIVMPFSSAWADDAIRFGVLAFRPKAQAIARWQPLADYLQNALGRRVNLQVYDLDELEAAVAHNTHDVVLTAPGQFMVLKHRYDCRHRSPHKSRVRQDAT